MARVGKEQVIQPTVSEVSQVPIDVHLGVHFEQQEALSGGVDDARVPTCSLVPSSEAQQRLHLPMHSRNICMPVDSSARGLSVAPQGQDHLHACYGSLNSDAKTDVPMNAPHDLACPLGRSMENYAYAGDDCVCSPLWLASEIACPPDLCLWTLLTIWPVLWSGLWRSVRMPKMVV